MDTADPAPNIVSKSITIKDVQLRTRDKRKLPVARQYYVQFSVGDTTRSTSVAKDMDNRTSWENVLHFDGRDQSVFVVKAYQKHRIGKNKLVGALTDTLDGVMKKLKDGVFEDALGKDTSDGSDLSGIDIKFTLTVQKRGNDSAEDRQASDARNRAIDAIKSLGSAPVAVDVLGSAVDVGNSAATEAQAFDIMWSVLLKRIELFHNIVDDIAQIHPYAALAWAVLSAATKVLIEQKNRDGRILRLSSAMSNAFAFVQDAEPLKAVRAHIKTITLLIKQVTECGYFINEYAKANFWVRAAKYKISDIDATIANYENKFQELKADFLAGVAVETEIAVVRMMNVMEDTAEAIDLNDMPYAFGARFQREKGCLPGTRESLLEDICKILSNSDDNAPRVCLLTGVAGSGKSAAAHSIARLFDEQRRLGSSYCFVSTDVAKRNPQNLFSTIARDLSDHDPQFKAALWGVVKSDRALRTSQSLDEQVEKFIIEPSKKVHAIGPLVVVIDALDESGDRARRRDLLRVLSDKIASLPINLRLLITARPEDDIFDAFPSTPMVARIQMGDIPEHVVDRDLEKFIHYSLHRYTDLESSWPNREWCRLLVGHSQHLFQWASTACKFIQGDNDVGRDPNERLDELLKASDADGSHPLDTLYQTILGQVFTSETTRERFKNVMAIILALNEPLSVTSLSVLFDGDRNIRRILKPMGSLLDGVHDEEKPIRPLHASFRDFLLHETRSSIFHVPIQPQHSLHLGQALLACMRKMLRFNICDLEDSRILNSEIPDLPSRVYQAIPPHLAYSCQYWMHHLQHVDHTPELLNDITNFFQTFFPYWLEAISLLTHSAPLSSILSAIESCTLLRKWAKEQQIATLALEASRFIQVFSPVLKDSTPHLYLSAMPQTPSNSPLCALWLKHLHKCTPVTSVHSTNWPAEIHTLQGHTDTVISVACSPDGNHIASGSHDMTIRIWNITTGQCVAGPFLGHTGEINSAAYSPCGKYLASGADDRSVRVWDVITGQSIVGPFQEPTSVFSVAYSPDGTHIASGSADWTVRVWNVTTGQCVAGPLDGHTDQVISVGYSPDGIHVVSGSSDNTIRIWNVVMGQCVTGPLQGHADKVHSVVYSPCGKYIASGSHDKTIQVWNAITGQSLAEPFQGHTQQVYSVVYSPNGRHVASGSRDNTIRVWDATTGQPVAGPFQGHTNAIASIVYSPDGAYMFSGSGDNTIRMWTTATGLLSANPIQGHTKSIKSVAYSPDGIHIASGSSDRTVRIWNVANGQCLAGPLLGHTSTIWSVAYSPDGTNIISGSGDKTIRVWDATTGQAVGDPFMGHTDEVYAVVYSPDGRHICSSSFDGTIRVWDAITGQSLADPLQGQFVSVVYSPDGNHVASGSADGTIMVWNVTTNECVVDSFEGHTDYIQSITYSPDGTCIASGSHDKTIRIWNAANGQCLTGPLQGHTDLVICVAYSPDGINLVSASTDKTIRVWNVVAGQCIAGPFQGHIDYPRSVSFSPDGHHIVTGSFDCSLKVWRFQELASLGNFLVEDGWMKSSSIGCIGWLAPWNRHAFQLPIHSLVISSHPSYKVNIDRSVLGESWISCWQ